MNSRATTKKATVLRSCKRDALLIQRLLELGDRRLLIGDGPCGGQIPHLSPEEWGSVYRACKRIVKRMA